MADEKMEPLKLITLWPVNIVKAGAQNSKQFHRTEAGDNLSEYDSALQSSRLLVQTHPLHETTKWVSALEGRYLLIT
jgi:hypothetical protein